MKCSECQKSFEYFPGEEAAYSKFNVPAPSNCSECRQKRRMMFRNEKNLYYNKSYKSGKQIIALYPEESPFRIIDNDEWLDDSFDAEEYGRDFDFSRPFFEQFAELQLEVPRWARISLNCENSDFTNNCANTNNSYLAFSCHDSEYIYHCVRVNRSRNCFDCYNLAVCEYCSNSLDCENCYDAHFSQLSQNCTSSYFMYDCRSCNDCILCVGLRNAKYMIKNIQYSREDYEKHKKEFLKTLAKQMKNYEAELEVLKTKIPQVNLQIIASENCIGDFVVNSKNIQNGFDVTKSEDSINVYNCDRVKDCCECFCVDKSELCLECDTNYEVYNSKFSTYFVGSKNVQYLDQCFFLEDCFGCIGLLRRKNMILNKQYSKEEYRKMVDKIEDYMKKTGEFGRPLPATFTAFAYNETVAQDSYPLTKEEAISKCYRWYEEKQDAKHFGQEYEIPENIEDADEGICDHILICEETKKNYKITPQEFELYKKLKLPLPRKAPDQRYKDLINRRLSQHLRLINCSSCNKEIYTTFPSDTPYEIYCEDCYLKTVY